MAITVGNLEKIYKVKKGADVRALKGISFNLPDKGMVFILGKSGCGKSTLLNLLGGLDSFDNGDIKIDGKSIKGYKANDLDRYRNDYVGFVFQENNLLETESAKRNVALALELQSEKDTDGKVEAVLESVGLKEFGERKCNTISGGQKQRVAIARALIKSPKLILCDEPTGALDSETGADIFDLLKGFSKERLVVVVSHDRESAEKYGDRIIELKDGEIISDNAPQEEIVATAQPGKKHGGLRFLRAFTLGTGYIIARPVRMAICLLLCLITFTCVGIVDAVNSLERDEAILTAMEEFGTQCYSFGRIHKSVYGYNLNDLGMSPDEAEELSSLLDVDRCDYMYRLSGEHSNAGPKKIDETRSRYSNATGYVEADAKFLEDYGFNLLAGRLPENTGEIAVTEFIYRYFKSYGYKDDKWNVTEVNSYGDLIGKEIKYESNALAVTVTGIVDTHFKYNEKTDLLFNGKEFKYGGYAIEFSSDMREVLSDDVQGMLFVCNGFKDYYYENFSVIEKWEVNKVIAPYKGSDAQKLKNIRVYTTRYDGEPVDTKYGDCYHVINYGAFLANESQKIFASVTPYVPYILAILIVINVLFLTYYASGTIEEKRREIGILRALGASRGDILKIIASEHGVFTLGAVTVASVISAIVAAVLNNEICKVLFADFAFLSFGIRQFAIVLGVAVLSVAVGIVFPLIKLLIKKPVDVIADRK